MKDLRLKHILFLATLPSTYATLFSLTVEKSAQCSISIFSYFNITNDSTYFLEKLTRLQEQ